MLVALFALAFASQSPACLDVRSGNATVILQGRLEERTYAMPDVGSGRPERAFILTLARPICIDDGGEFANPRERFSRVQLYASNDRLRGRLRAGLGHRVRILGTGFAGHTAHHHAPLVVEIGMLTIGGR